MRHALILLFFVFAIQLAGQTLLPIPERLVSIECSNKRTDEVLRDIARQGKFEIAWDAKLFDAARPVTIHAKQITVRRAIYLIFGNTITFRVKGNYLILEAAPLPLAASPQPAKKLEYTLSGYVIDSAEYVIPYSSVYDSTSLSATLSNQYGFYEMKLAAGTQPMRIHVRKQNYADTFIIVTPSSNMTMDIVMRKIPPPVVSGSVVIDSVSLRKDTVAAEAPRKIENIPFLDSLIGFEQLVQSRNLTETLKRNGQISLLPFISTNGVLAGTVSNKYSFNVIGGYTGGTSVAELGGVFNIDRGDVQWVQVAGAFNLVEGNTRGLQLSGGVNANFGTMEGLQLTGGVNMLFDSLTGIQFAGGANLISGHVKGMQLAGGTNIATNDLDGMQIAGGANFVFGKMNRLQVAAGLNVCTDSMKGMQIAVMNVAKDVNGVQFGILNYANSYSKGAPVGLISIVLHGVHEIEIATTERGFVNFALHTGTHAFYNTFNFGFDPQTATDRLWMFGYGIGHRFGIHPKFDLALDAVVNHVSSGNISAYTSEWCQLSLTAEWRPWKPFAIAAGPVLHYYITGSDRNELAGFQQAPFYSGHPADGFRDVAWVGATFSLRFF